MKQGKKQEEEASFGKTKLLPCDSVVILVKNTLKIKTEIEKLILILIIKLLKKKKRSRFKPCARLCIRVPCQCKGTMSVHTTMTPYVCLCGVCGERVGVSVHTTMTPYVCLCGVCGERVGAVVECRVPENTVRHLKQASVKNFSHRMKFQSGND